MKQSLFTAFMIVASICALFAQDLRERLCSYEILTPLHEPKPLVEGYASERVTEKLNKGLQSALSDLFLCSPQCIIYKEPIIH